MLKQSNWHQIVPRYSRTDETIMGGQRGHKHTWMEIINPSTSAKPVMAKLQNLFVALVNIDIFQMTPKLNLFTLGF